MEGPSGLPWQQPMDSADLSDELAAEGLRLDGLLDALAEPQDTGRLPGELAALAAFRAHAANDRQSRSRRPRMLAHLTMAKLTAAALTSGLVVTGGATAAATGSLPGAAQQTARDMLARVGVEVPGPDDRAGSHPASRGNSAEHNTHRSTDRSQAPDHPTDRGKGDEVSDVATSTSETGVDKGATISDTASEGKSRAGEGGDAGEGGNDGATGPAGAPDGGGDAPQSHAPGDAPNPDEAAAQGSVSSDASEDASDNGAATSDEASGGHSGAGVDRDGGERPR